MWRMCETKGGYSKRNILVKNCNQPELLYNEEFVFAYVHGILSFNQSMDKAVVHTVPYVLFDADSYDLVHISHIMLYKLNLDTRVHEVFCRFNVGKAFKQTDDGDWVEITPEEYVELKRERVEYTGLLGTRQTNWEKTPEGRKAKVSVPFSVRR